MPPITMRCSQCGASLQVPELLCGLAYACDTCGKINRVPGTPLPPPKPAKPPTPPLNVSARTIVVMLLSFAVVVGIPNAMRGCGESDRYDDEARYAASHDGRLTGYEPSPPPAWHGLIDAAWPLWAACVLLWLLGSLPGKIARSRNHPQAEAITVCGWLGLLLTGGLLWVVAMVWAYTSDRGAPSRNP